MYKDATNLQKIDEVRHWMPLFIESIKKEIKNDHLKKDPYFLKNYFPGKTAAKLSTEELAEGYLSALRQEEKSEEIAEFLISCWLMKHPELYHLFESHLTQVTQDFSSLEQLTEEQTKALLQPAIAEFGPYETYLFSVFNSVVFSKETFEELKKQAQAFLQNQAVAKQEEQERQDLEGMQKKHATEMARLTDKYEKKLMGLQKKYQLDQEALKKQLAALQRKLQAGLS